MAPVDNSTARLVAELEDFEKSLLSKSYSGRAQLVRRAIERLWELEHRDMDTRTRT